MTIRPKNLLYFFSLITVLFSVTPAFSQGRTLVKRLRFAKGQSSATIRGSIQTTDYLDYRFNANEGQTMTVHLKTSKGKMRFQIGAVQGPGPYKGADMVMDWEGTLPVSGEQLIILYADSKSVNCTLEVTID